VSALNPAIPPELDPIVKRALEKDLYSRYKTGADFAKDLTAARYQLQEEEVEKLNDRFELLRSLPVFAQFERVERWEVLRITTWRTVGDGIALMEAGDETGTFGVLIDGEVEVSLDTRLLARLELGGLAELHRRPPAVVPAGVLAPQIPPAGGRGGSIAPLPLDHPQPEAGAGRQRGRQAFRGNGPQQGGRVVPLAGQELPPCQFPLQLPAGRVVGPAPQHRQGIGRLRIGEHAPGCHGGAHSPGFW
jgi:hypothetical protein